MRFCWLVGRLGYDRILSAPMVLPHEAGFHSAEAATQADLRPLLDRISSVMGISAANVELEVCGDEQLPSARAHYDIGPPPVIRVAESSLRNFSTLIATLAHELAHHLLLGSDLISPEVRDHELVTDLVPVVLGLGLIHANTTIEESHVRDGRYYAWSMQQRGYLASRTIGYALALWSHVRDERETMLNEWLRPDAADTYRRGLKYVLNSPDCMVQSRSIRDVHWPRAMDVTQSDLRHKAPHRRLIALWELFDWTMSDLESIRADIEALAKDRTAEVRSTAFEVMATMNRPAPSFQAAVVSAFGDRSPAVRCAAAELAARWTLAPSSAVDRLCTMLASSDRDEVTIAAACLRAYELQAQDAAIPLVDMLFRAIVDCDYPLIDELVTTLRAVTSDPISVVKAMYRDEDSVKQQMVRTALQERATRR